MQTMNIDVLLHKDIVSLTMGPGREEGQPGKW